MEPNNIYKKPYAELDEHELEILETARQVLVDGNRLYGMTKDDVSHIEYAIGLVLSSLGELYEGDALATVVEIGVDEGGNFVTFIMNDDLNEV